MSNINTVALGGNLTRDPELRHTKNGTPVVNLGLAVNRSVKRDDEWEDETSFFEVTVFGGRGEMCAKKLSTGSQVMVQGRLEQQRWETENDEKRSKVVVIAQTIEGPDFFKPASENRDIEAQGEKGEDQATLATDNDDDIPF